MLIKNEAIFRLVQSPERVWETLMRNFGNIAKLRLGFQINLCCPSIVWRPSIFLLCLLGEEEEGRHVQRAWVRRVHQRVPRLSQPQSARQEGV